MKFELGQHVIVYGQKCEIIECYKTKHHGEMYKLMPQPDPKWEWYYESLCIAVPNIEVEIFEEEQ